MTVSPPETRVPNLETGDEGQQGHGQRTPRRPAHLREEGRGWGRGRGSGRQEAPQRSVFSPVSPSPRAGGPPHVVPGEP